MSQNIGFDSRKIKEIKFKRQEKTKKKKRKIMSIILLLFLFIMLILGAGSYILIKYLANKAEENIEKSLENAENGNWQSKWQEITEESKESIKNKKLEERGTENDILSDGEVSIILNLVERKEEVALEKAREGYEFIIFNLNIKNQKYEEVLFYISNFILRDSRYTEYVMKQIEIDEINLLRGMQNIPAREEIEGSMIYEVQKNVGALELIYAGEKKLIFEIE